MDLLKFGVSGDTRPPACNDTANYPTAIINAIGDAEKAAGAQFALDLGDHMFVCNNHQATADAQMNKFMQGVAHFGGTWFMTEGNHECMGAGSGFCPLGSTNVNYQAFLNALAPIASKPYYKRNIHTRLGLATFVFIADNSWDSAQETWLENTLTTADSNATYTIICKHHPQGDTSIASNQTIMQVIRRHKFSLLLTGHVHEYAHQSADSGRDLVMGLGGAPFSGGANYHGYAIVDQKANGKLRVSVYDVHTGTLHDQWTVDPN
ncbi:MAG: metallophosphoesterase [Deltaproteobacteria bacterium]|nr:metallophosphoesterase [Deltaproteobacteria bacterium]